MAFLPRMPGSSRATWSRRTKHPVGRDSSRCGYEGLCILAPSKSPGVRGYIKVSSSLSGHVYVTVSNPFPFYVVLPNAGAKAHGLPRRLRLLVRRLLFSRCDGLPNRFSPCLFVAALRALQVKHVVRGDSCSAHPVLIIRTVALNWMTNA